MDGEKMCGWLGCSGGWLVGTLGLDRPCYRCRTDTNTGMGGEKEGGGGYFLCFLTLSLTCNDENPAPFSSRAFSLPFVNFAVA